MGLISFFKRNSLTNKNRNDLDTPIVRNTPFVQSEIKKLLWISNGPLKNFSNPIQSVEYYKYEGFTMKVTSAGPNEPSAINTKATIRKPLNKAAVPRPPYYPFYDELSPEQKWLYWDFLSTPYSGKHDIGYVFIFYYGLERHLFEGNFEEAFNVILKLRDVYDNSSFQSYSAYALMLSCIMKKNTEYAYRFIESVDKEHELNFNPHLYFFCKAVFNIPVSSNDILRYYKVFSFTNNRYIKNNYALFSDVLKQKMNEHFGQETITISEIMTDRDWSSLKGINIPVFANVSLRDDNYVAIPNFILTSWGGKVLIILQDTHETVKKILAEQRKSKRANEVKTIKNT